jgi:hypothetical protein
VKLKITLVAVLGLGLTAVPAHAAAKTPAKWNDFNGDGKRDIVISGQSNVTVYYSGSKKVQRFRAWDSKIKALSIASADFDRDGYADLAVTGDTARPGVTIVYGSRTGLTKRTAFLPTGPITVRWGGPGMKALAVGDFNRNGRPDLVATADQKYWLFKDVGKGTTQAQPVTVTWPETDRFTHGHLQPVVGDFTGDGHQDLAFNVSNDDWGFSLFDATILLAKAAPDGTLGAARPLPYQGGFVTAGGDFNGDKRADLVVASYSPDVGLQDGGVSVLYGQADGLSRPQSITQRRSPLPGADKDGSLGYAISVGDINRDRRSDLVVSSRWNSSVWVIFGSHKGLAVKSAQRIAKKPGSDFGIALSVSDVTGDRWPDLVVGAGTYGARKVHVLKNRRGRIGVAPVRTITDKKALLYGLL